MWLEGPPDKMRCIICGWEGDGRQLGSSWPMEHEGPDKYALRKAGRLFTLRVWFEPGNDDAVFEALEILQINGGDSSGGRLKIELSMPPQEATLAALRALQGVARVTVY
jgi:hypothetical protein